MVPPMQPEATPDRRTVVVAAVLGTAGLGALAGCSSDSGGTSRIDGGVLSPNDDTPQGSPSGGGSGLALVAVTKVPVGGAVAVQAAQGAIVVARPSAGRVVAHTAICTHQGCNVVPQPQGNRLECPCHGSTFDAFTGEVLRGPAKAPLAGVPVTISGQDVVAG
jgi:cytochrome b6-f complex iron-sulfur subunit